MKGQVKQDVLGSGKSDVNKGARRGEGKKNLALEGRERSSH